MPKTHPLLWLNWNTPAWIIFTPNLANFKPRWAQYHLLNLSHLERPNIHPRLLFRFSTRLSICLILEFRRSSMINTQNGMPYPMNKDPPLDCPRTKPINPPPTGPMTPINARDFPNFVLGLKHSFWIKSRYLIPTYILQEEFHRIWVHLQLSMTKMYFLLTFAKFLWTDFPSKCYLLLFKSMDELDTLSHHSFLSIPHGPRGQMEKKATQRSP